MTWAAYKVWQEGEEDFARLFDDCCGSNAAEQWAKEYDETEEHNIANGAKVAVLVERIQHNYAEPLRWRYVVSGRWKAKYKAELDRGEK